MSDGMSEANRAADIYRNLNTGLTFLKKALDDSHDTAFGHDRLVVDHINEVLAEFGLKCVEKVKETAYDAIRRLNTERER